MDLPPTHQREPGHSFLRDQVIHIDKTRHHCLGNYIRAVTSLGNTPSPCPKRERGSRCSSCKFPSNSANTAIRQKLTGNYYSSGTVICVGGPALVQAIRPTDEELFKRYNPELQKRSLEEGDRRAQEFDDYVNRLKQWSKSDKSSMFPILG